MTLALVHDLIILIACGLVAAIICRMLNVSILIGYLVVGAAVGPGVLGWVNDENHHISHFAEAGVFLLLFSIGLEFSIDDLKRLGRRFIIGGASQMLFVAIPVALVLLGYGLSWQATLLIAAAATFSPTVLVFRALSEIGHSQLPHGRRAIGILLFQDAALVPLLLMVPMLTDDGGAPSAATIIQLVAISLSFIVAVIGIRHVLAEWIIPIFSSYRSSELVVLFAVASISGVTLAAYHLGLPAAVGAFAAGLIFNGNRWSHQIDALILPFRETFAAIFFVGLGMIFDPSLLWHQPVLLLVLPAIIGLKAIAAALALSLTGLKFRNAMGTGIGLAHVGEFAFVLLLFGVDSGVLAETEYQMAVSIAVGSLVLTPGLMRAGIRLVRPGDEEATDAQVSLFSAQAKSALVVGAGPMGQQAALHLQSTGHDVCVVDLSPVNLHSLAQQGIRTITGDGTDPTIQENAQVSLTELVVIAVPDDGVAMQLTTSVRDSNPDCKILVRCRYVHSIPKLKKLGATEMIAEETIAATALLKLFD